MAIYFLRAGKDGPVKIGWAKTVDARRKNLQTANHETLSVIRKIDDGDQRQEKRLHWHFRDAHVSGEWFRFDPEMLAVDPAGLPDKPVGRPAKDVRNPWDGKPAMSPAELRAWRARYDLSQAQLAELLGMSLSRIGEYERGYTFTKNRSADIPRVVELALKGLENNM